MSILLTLFLPPDHEDISTEDSFQEKGYIVNIMYLFFLEIVLGNPPLRKLLPGRFIKAGHLCQGLKTNTLQRDCQQSINWFLFFYAPCQCAISSAYWLCRAMHFSWGLKQKLHSVCFISILILFHYCYLCLGFWGVCGLDIETSHASSAAFRKCLLQFWAVKAKWNKN